MKILFAVGIVVAGLAFPAGAYAQTSCSAWNSTCNQRCAQSNGGQACQSYCQGQMNACRQSGCWTEGRNFGGASHCNLRKG